MNFAQHYESRFIYVVASASFRKYGNISCGAERWTDMSKTMKSDDVLPLVVVVMSSYNGSKYIREQIDSILSQKGVRVVLFIRDDGSTDETCEIVKRIQEQSENIILEMGKNVGWRRGFLMALRDAPVGDYYAFADQDDIWCSDKLATAVTSLQEKSAHSDKEVAQLYGGNVLICDEKLRPIRLFNEAPSDPNKMRLVRVFAHDNQAGGLTYVFNNEARSLLARVALDEGFRGHDAWLMLLCRCFGQVIWDNEPHVYYRQHGDNAIGASPGVTERVKRKFKVLFSGKPVQDKFAASFLRDFSKELDGEPDFKLFLSDVAHYRESWKIALRVALNRDFRRDRLDETLALKAKVLIGRY